MLIQNGPQIGRATLEKVAMKKMRASGKSSRSSSSVVNTITEPLRSSIRNYALSGHFVQIAASLHPEFSARLNFHLSRFFRSTPWVGPSKDARRREERKNNQGL